MKTCGKCEHSNFIKETSPYGQCLVDRMGAKVIILKFSKACLHFKDKEAKKNGKDK